MQPTLSDNQISAVIGGLLGIAGVLIGVLAVTLQGWITRRSRRKGVVRIIGYELATNVEELTKWSVGTSLPVRSNYLWEALRAEVPGLLKPEQVNSVAEFYYRQAQVYKLTKPSPQDRDALVKKGTDALVALGIKSSAS